MSMEAFFSYEIALTLITLTFLEIVLGIDNLIFIAIVVSNLPDRYKKKARFIGIGAALVIRILMLMTLSWVMTLTKPLFYLGESGFSVNSVLLILGGLFLIVKPSIEIYSSIYGSQKDGLETKKKFIIKETFFGAVVQIALVDFIFSFDSIITAIAMTKNIIIIIIAVVISMILMLFSSDYISRVLNKYPNLKIMALAFIFMVGVILLADGFHFHISKGYLYFSLFFALGIEFLNILAIKKAAGK